MPTPGRVGGKLSIGVSWALVALCCAGVFAAPASAAAPSAPRLGSLSSSTVALRWASAGWPRVQVLRNGVAIATVSGDRFHDRSVRAATSYRYSLRGVSGARSSRSPTTWVTTMPGGCQVWALAGAAGGDGSPARPFGSARRAAQAAAGGGTVCLVGAFREDLTIDRGGVPGRPLVLRAAPGYRASVTGRMWIADSADDVFVHGLRLDGRNPTHLPSPTINGDRVTFVRNDVTSRHSSICFILGSVNGYGQARAAVLDSNRIHNCGVLPANNHQHGVYLENTLGARLVNNAIFSNADRGIQLYPNAQGSLITGNVVDANGQGIIFSGADGYASSRNRVTRNVFSNARLRYNIESYWPVGNPVGTGNVATDNCLWRGRQGNVGPQVGFSVRRSIVADPRYVSRAGGDFRMRQGSACAKLIAVGSALVALP